MTDDSKDPSEEQNFLADPTVAGAFGEMLDEFAHESDRGAVLIAADIVSNHLGAIIEELAPELLQTKIKNLLNYPGVLSTFAARADIALLAGYIDRTAYRSIDLLRKLRNDAAHSQNAFRLTAHRKTLQDLYDLGPGTATAINRFASELILRSFVEAGLATGIDLEPKLGNNPFSTPKEVLDYLQGHAKAKQIFQDRVPKTELAFGVWILLGLISYRRKTLTQKSAGMMEQE
jgi:hypothetical protein